ncbi:hypothetical protein ACFQ36_17690, partial [Arthrobacter sp. GCM10027362]|uniref:hypothetical protein n=1 Tax=Arthrobacter sp. GCM10027362 TaxID=3273379 RepID=UPI0036355FE1
GALVVVVQGRDFWRRPFLGDAGYAELGLGGVDGMMVRLLVLAVGTVMAAGFMLVLPGRPGVPTLPGAWTAAAGRHTMYPYLLHLPLLTIVGASPLVELGPPTVRTLAFLAASVLFCALAASPPVRFLARPLVEPHSPVQDRLRRA